MRPTPDQQAVIKRISREIASIGPCLPGTLVVRLSACGKPYCSCRADPPRLHGPYNSWTQKVGGKTVTRLLTDEQLGDYEEMFENAKRLRALISQLESVGLAMADADTRWKPPRTRSRARTTKT